VASLPDLRAIGFNGGTAARIGRRMLAGMTAITLVDLPSSSPAYTRPFAEKREKWLGMHKFVDPSADKSRF
jgi:double-stranded uracil-DNA glycosylase